MEEYFPIIVAAAAALLAWGLGALIVGLVKNEKRKLSERLTGASGVSGAATVAASIVVQPENQDLPRLLARSAFMRALNRRLVHAYPEASLVKFLIVSVSLALVGGLIMLALMESPWVAVGGAAGAGYVPYMLVMRKRNRRQRQLAEQLPEALDFLQRILRAGHSLSTGLSMMGEELPQPLSGEFRKCYDEHSLGQPLDECMRDMARRIESTDYAFFVTAVLIQRESGGNLSEILDNLAHVVRERFKIRRQVRVHTAHGRFTGYVLLALPAALAVALTFINPELMALLFEEHMGRVMLFGAVVLQVCGFFWIRQVMRIEV
jgi:tight adherence protein B